MISTSILRSLINPCCQQLFFSFNSISTPLSTKQTLIDPNPPLVGQAIEVKEFLRQNSISFDESWTCIKALCCRSSNRISGLIHIGKERGREKQPPEMNFTYFSGDFACSKCSTTGTWVDFKAQWEHLRTRFIRISFFCIEYFLYLIE